MNVSQMLTGYAFDTIKPAIIRTEAKPEPSVVEARNSTLSAGRATMTAKADKRRADMSNMIKTGSSSAVYMMGQRENLGVKR